MEFPRTAEDDTVLSNTDIARAKELIAQADDVIALIITQAAVRCAEANDGADLGMSRGEFIRFYVEQVGAALRG